MFNDFATNLFNITHWNAEVMALGNENAEEIWLLDYSDGADMEDKIEMAKDSEIIQWLYDSYKYIMKHFKR